MKLFFNRKERRGRKEKTTGIYYFLALFAFFAVNCRQQLQGDINAAAHQVHVDTFMANRLTSEINDLRKHKDEQFRTSPDSPIPMEIKPAFSGLAYYPLDWKYRFEGPVNRYENPPRIIIIATDGEKRDAVRYGYIRFSLDGSEIRLQVYKLQESGMENILFIPFTDVNAGKETYPAGRYIDLEEKPDGRYVIDFNKAYNPFCAYGGDYSCPVTPKENHLKVAIPAGEKILPLAAVLDAKRQPA